jgi:hypothetical protein
MEPVEIEKVGHFFLDMLKEAEEKGRPLGRPRSAPAGQNQHE